VYYETSRRSEKRESSVENTRGVKTHKNEHPASAFSRIIGSF
jgi:hypothetical protein